MALEYVDLKYGRIYFVRGTHQLHYLPGIKKLAARSYLGIKRALEEAMRNSDALAEECVYFLGDIRKYPRGLKNLRFQVDESNLNPGDDTDYTILKCIKEGKDLYWCDVFQGAGAIRKLADIFLPGALMLELGAIIQLSAPQYMWPYLVFLATYAGYSLKTLVKPDFRTSRALRRLGRLLLPLRGIIYKFREITTAIQLKILLFEIYKKKGRLAAITYFSQGGHTDQVKKYLQWPMDKLSDELHNMLDVQKLFNIYFRAAIRIPISEWPSEKKERMIQAARSKGFNVDAI